MPEQGKGVFMEDWKEGKIISTPLEAQMKNSYIDYAMSVIVTRALPDVRDGLKPHPVCDE